MTVSNNSGNIPRHPARREQPDRSRAGLSILELLVALVLLVAITSGLVASLGLGIRLLDRSRDTDQVSESLTVRTRIRTWLAAAAPSALLEEDATTLAGTSDRLTFATTASALPVPGATLQQVEIDLIGDGLNLVVTARDTGGTVLQRAETRITGLGGSLRLDYHGEVGTDWTSNWTDPSRLPIAVRIRSEQDDPISTFWPEFTVRPLLR